MCLLQDVHTGSASEPHQVHQQSIEAFEACHQQASSHLALLWVNIHSDVDLGLEVDAQHILQRHTKHEAAILVLGDEARVKQVVLLNWK